MDGGVALRDCAPALDVATATPFETFFRINHDFVWRNLRRLGVPTAVVDDALQDVFVTAHRRLGQLRPDASERAWLYTILRRVAFRYRRTEHRRRRKIDALEAVAPSEHRDRSAEGVDARRFMRRFLADLGDKRGPVFAMVELEGMSAPEVADALGLKLNTVYSRLRLGRVAFEREVERQHAREREELLAAARRADDPPVGAAAAAWMLIDPRMIGAESGATPSIWSLAGQVKVFLATVAVGSLLVVGARAIAGTAHVASPPEPPPTASAPASDPGVLADHAVVEGTVAPDETRGEPGPSPRTVAPDALGAEPAPSPGVRGRPRPTRGGIDAEAALLKQAKTAMTRDPGVALRGLDEHARRYPDSALADLRDAMRVAALCAVGEPTRARAAADAFERAHPDSRFVERVRATCRGDGT